MQLDLLALKARKSISQLLTRNSGTESALPSTGPSQTEKGATNLKTLDPSPDKASARPSANDSPSSNESLSRSKGLMGSLRTNKLRSINSLRSLRSPTKGKQPATTATPCADSPRTPSHRPKSSLVLNFEESPADEPIFDLSCESSTHFSQDMYYSSPVPIPSSEKQKARSFSACPAIPDGTIPSSPAPIRKALYLEQIEDFPSPAHSTAFDVDMTCMELLAPMQDMQELNQPGDTLLETPEIAQAATKSCHGSAQDSENDQLSEADVMKLMSDSQYMQRGPATDVLMRQYDGPCPAAEESTAGASGNLLVIISEDYLLKFFHCGDGKRRVSIRALCAHERYVDPETEVIVARRDEDFAAAEKIIAKMSRFMLLNKNMFGRAETELVLDEAIAEGVLPEWLDVELEMDTTAEFLSRTTNIAKTQKRESVCTWGQHAGLYDGSGYGAESSSRSSTETQAATDAACRYVDAEEEMDQMRPASAYRRRSRLDSTSDSHHRQGGCPGMLVVAKFE